MLNDSAENGQKGPTSRGEREPPRALENDMWARPRTPRIAYPPLGMQAAIDRTTVWTESGVATSTSTTTRTRRDQGLLVARQGDRRFMLVNGIEAFAEVDGKKIALTSQLYAPRVVHPDGATRIREFAARPWPRWTFDLGDGLALHEECLVRDGTLATFLSFRLSAPRPGARARVRPLLSGRSIDSLQAENPRFSFDATVDGERVAFRPYPDVPGILVASNGRFERAPVWYRRFLYEDEGAALEDLASPGTFELDISRGEAHLVFAVDTGEMRALLSGASVASLAQLVKLEERRRRRDAS
jgi:glycogen debranching enzyme